MHNTARGIPVPDAGDDLLSAYERSFSTAGFITPVTSLAAARAIVAKAEADGFPASNEHPFYFDLNGIMYKCTGYKGGNGVYDLQVINEAKTYLQTAPGSIAGNWTVGVGNWKSLITMNIPVMPFPRMYMAVGTAWTRISAGSLDLEIYTNHGARNTTFKSHVNGQDDDNTECTAFGVIYEGETPDITMWFKSVKDRSNANNRIAKFELTADSWTRLAVMTWPMGSA